MAEVQDRLYRTFRGVLHEPFQVLRLEVCDSDVAHDSLLAKLDKGRKSLLSHLPEICEFHIMDIDKVDVVDIEPFHAFIHAFSSALCRIIPCIDSVLTVTAHLGRKVVFVPRNVLQGLSKHGFSLKMAIIRRYINEVDSILHGCEDGLDGLILLYAAEDASQRRCAEAEIGHAHAGLSYFVIDHS